MKRALPKIIFAFIAISLSACAATQYYQKNIFGRWVYQNPDYTLGIQFWDNGNCFWLNSDLSRRENCTYKMRGKAIYVTRNIECIAVDKGCSGDLSEFRYSPKLDQLSIMIAARRSKLYASMKRVER